MITISHAKLKDIKACIKIDKSLKEKINRQFLKEAILSNRVFIAKEKNEIAGYLIFNILWGEIPFIEFIKITPAYQRQLIGTNLIKKIENKFKKLGFKFLYSSTSRKNKKSITFHKATGFKKCGDVELDKEKEIFFKKKINKQ
ncbi:MAG: GNAT family N-acetyltransferase [Patescibacteria group bacterium]